MLWCQQHDHTTLNLCNCICNNQSMSYFNNFALLNSCNQWHTQKIINWALKDK